jgi:hypothetical protein
VNERPKTARAESDRPRTSHVESVEKPKVLRRETERRRIKRDEPSSKGFWGGLRKMVT